MTVTLTVDSVYVRVTGSDEATDHIFDKAFSYYVDGYKFMPAYKSGQWDGKRHLYSYGKFLAGLLDEAVALLVSNHIPHEVIDTRVRPDGDIKAWNLRGAEQREHQSEAIVAALEAGRGTIWHATGAGKTEVMAALIQMLNLKALVLVNQATIASQTRTRLQDRLRRPIGLITGSKKVDGDIVCATFQSLQSQLKNDKENQTQHLKRFLRKFDVLCIDEAHHALAKTYSQVINSCPAYYRFAFSATYEKTKDKGARLHVVGSTGPVIDRFTAGEGVEKGLLVPANITFVKWHEDSPSPSWGKEDFEIDDRLYRYTGKKFEWLEKPDGSKVKRALKNPEPGLYDVAVVKHRVRNGVIVDAAAAMYEDGLTTLILVERIDHGLMLKKAIERDLKTPVLFLQGANSQNERETVKRKFSSGENRILIATTIFDEGVDVPAIDGLIFAQAGKAQHRVIQRLGRGMRTKKGKESLEVIDLYDTHSKTLWKHAQERLKAYQSDTTGYRVKIENL